MVVTDDGHVTDDVTWS